MRPTAPKTAVGLCRHTVMPRDECGESWPMSARLAVDHRDAGTFTDAGTSSAQRLGTSLSSTIRVGSPVYICSDGAGPSPMLPTVTTTDLPAAADAGGPNLTDWLTIVVSVAALVTSILALVYNKQSAGAAERSATAAEDAATVAKDPAAASSLSANAAVHD